MEHNHLDAATLEDLLALDRTAKQNEQLLHLLAVCPRCCEVGGWLLELHQANALPAIFGPIDAALARSRAEAPRLLAELLPLDPEERLVRVHADRRFVSWGLCELLIRRSCQTAPEQPAEAFHLADLAVYVADRISESGLFEERVYQLRGLAWAALGNTLRVQGDLREAERSFDSADSWWGAGTVTTEDALGYEPILGDLKASLRIAQRRFPEALRLLDAAIERFFHGEFPDPHLAGRSLITKALLLIETGDTGPALQALRKASGLIDPGREPRLLLCIHHNLVHTLSSAIGRFQEAADLLPKLKELAAAHGSAKDRLRLEWVEGRVAAGLGDHDHARALLTQVRQTFLAESNAFDASLVSLDLSISYLEQGKAAEVRELADELVIVFRSLDVAREPMAALLLFQEAARQETATVELAREVAASLTQARQALSCPGGIS